MHLFEPFLINMRVDLRRRDVRMAEHLLDHAEVGTVVEEVRGKGVPQQVWMHAITQTSVFGPLLDDLINPRSGEDSAVDGKEDMALRLRPYQSWPRMCEVGADRLTGRSAYWRQACFVAFTRHANPAFLQAQVFQSGLHKFGQTQTASIEEFQDGPVAAVERTVAGDRFHELSCVLLIQRVRQVFFLPWGQDGFRRITDPFALGSQPEEENFQGDQLDSGAGGGQAVTLAPGQIFRDHGRADRGGIFDLPILFSPGGKGLQHAANEHLIVRGKPALSGKVEDKAVDGIKHGATLMQSRPGAKGDVKNPTH